MESVNILLVANILKYRKRCGLRGVCAKIRRYLSSDFQMGNGEIGTR